MYSKSAHICTVAQSTSNSHVLKITCAVCIYDQSDSTYAETFSFQGIDPPCYCWVKGFKSIDSQEDEPSFPDMILYKNVDNKYVSLS